MNIIEFISLAKSEHTHLSELRRLASYKIPEVSQHIALHPNCDHFLLAELRSLSNEEVNCALAFRYNSFPNLYSIQVREVRSEDAEYIYKLRTDERYNKHLSAVGFGVDEQRKYIENYSQRKKYSDDSFYFILKNRVNGQKCGTVRLYNFVAESFEWGSWILDENKSRYAALETAIFVYEFGFKVLGFKESDFNVRNENHNVINYHKRSGADVVSVDHQNHYFKISKNKALAFCNELRQKIEKTNFDV